MGIFRFSFKVGIAALGVYYLKEEGVWKDSETALKSLDKWNQTVSPYLEEIKARVPIELPKIPKSEYVHHSLGNYWNLGVSMVFNALMDSPMHVSNWTNKGIESILQNEEVKNLVNPNKS